MSLHPLAENFAGVAGAYERGRPEYAPAVIGAILAETGLAPGARVLDLAAGTGKVSRALVVAGLDVAAVEPQAAMRELLGEAIGAERALDGRAEAIPLPDGSVAAVTIGDGFHWFDQAAALAEIARVLVPGGALVLLSSGRDWRPAPWAEQMTALVIAERPEHPHFDGPPWQDAVRAAGGWSEPWELQVRRSQPVDRALMIDYLCSFSWVAAMSERRREQLLLRANEILDSGELPAQLPVIANVGLARRL